MILSGLVLRYFIDFEDPLYKQRKRETEQKKT